MPRDSGGTFTLVSGNPVSSGTLIESTWANTTMPDLANGLTESLSRSGEGGMLAPLHLVDGSIGAPALSFLNDVFSGLSLGGASEVIMSIGSNNSMRWNASGVYIWNGASWDPVPTGSLGDYLAVDGSNAMLADLDLGAFGLVNLKTGGFGPPGGTDLSISVDGDDDTGLFADGSGQFGMVSNADDWSSASQVYVDDTSFECRTGSVYIKGRNSLDVTAPSTMTFRAGTNDAFTIQDDADAFPNLELDFLGTTKIANAVDPVDAQDYVTKAYGDANYGSGGAALLVNGSNFAFGTIRFAELVAGVASGGDTINYYVTNASGFPAGAPFLTTTYGELTARYSGGPTLMEATDTNFRYFNSSFTNVLSSSDASGDQVFTTSHANGDTQLAATDEDLSFFADTATTSFLAGGLGLSYRDENNILVIEANTGTFTMRAATFNFNTVADANILLLNSGGSTLGSTLVANNHNSGTPEDVLTTSDLGAGIGVWSVDESVFHNSNTVLTGADVGKTHVLSGGPFTLDLPTNANGAAQYDRLRVINLGSGDWSISGPMFEDRGDRLSGIITTVSPRNGFMYDFVCDNPGPTSNWKVMETPIGHNAFDSAHDINGGRESRPNGITDLFESPVDAEGVYKITWMIDAEQGDATGDLDVDFDVPASSSYALQYVTRGNAGAGTDVEIGIAGESVGSTALCVISTFDDTRYIQTGEMTLYVTASGSVTMRGVCTNTAGWLEGLSYMKVERMDKTMV